MFAVNLCKKVEVCVVKKWVDTLKFHGNLCVLLALKSSAKGAQHHNKQKTTLQSCKHLAVFDVNLCRKVSVLRSTNVGRYLEI